MHIKIPFEFKCKCNGLLDLYNFMMSLISITNANEIPVKREHLRNLA